MVNKKEPTNYKKNLDILNSFKRKCNEKTFVDEVYYIENTKYKHYVVEDVHVYIGGDTCDEEIVLSNQPSTLCDLNARFLDGKAEISLVKSYRVYMLVSDKLADYVSIEYFDDGGINVWMEMDPDGDDRSQEYNGEHSTEDPIETVLDKAIQFYKDSPKSKNMLEQAQGFYAHVLSIYREEHSMTNDLGELSEEKLQAALEELKRNNQKKEQPLATTRREQLLSRIRAEQQKGQMIDEQISDIQANMSRGV